VPQIAPARPGRGRAVALAILAAGLTLTLTLAALVRSSTLATERDAFLDGADALAAATADELESNFARLRDIGAFVANAPGTSNERFQRFVRDTRLFDELPSVVGVFFIHRVPHRELDAFIEEMRLANPGFSVYPIGARAPDDDYHLLSYYMPGTVDLQLPLGTDVTPIDSVREFIEQSATTGSAVVGSFQQDPQLQQIAAATGFEPIASLLDLDFFIGLPVYDDARTAAGDLRPVGWVGASIDEFEEVTLGAAGEPRELGYRLRVDITALGPGASTIERVAERQGSAGPLEDAAFQKTFQFEVQGVRWTLTAWSPPEAAALSLWVPVTVIGGALASCLGAGVVLLRVRARDDEQRLTDEIRDNEQFQRDILESVTSPMVVLDAEGTIVRANPAWHRLVAGIRNPAPASGPPTYARLLEPALRSGATRLDEALRRALSGGTDSVEVDVAIEQGSRHRWFAVRVAPLRGRRRGAVVIHTDITERKRSHDELQLKASHDPLTGVLNRAGFTSEVTAALARARVDNGLLAVLFIDLDAFKPINDRHGHATGDAVLRAVAQRIEGVVRTTDRVGRLGGDEFVVLLRPLPNHKVAEQTADRIRRVLSTPVHVQGEDIPLRASIGVALVENPLGETTETVIQRADACMYVAKQSGGDRFVVA
jgi:diguanylate cyclase (GGDEF)-like protein